MMKKDARIYLIFIILLSSCKHPHAPPSFELCVALEKVGIKNCVDNRLPDMKNGKDMPIQAGDIIMPADSFKSIMNWGMDLRRDLISCENRN